MIEYLIRKRKIALLAFLAVVVFGVISFLRLPQQQIPDLVISQAMVTTVYPGATPETVEQTITKKIEQKIKEMEGVDTITSTSSEGLSTIMVMLDSGVNAEKKWQELRTKVQDVQGDLPKDAMQPIVNDDLVTTFISSYAITNEDPEKLKELSTLMTSWKDQLRAIPGIADVTITGLPDQEIQVNLDTQKMANYGISWGQVSQAVAGENNRTPIGNIDYNERNYQLRVSNLESIDALNSVMVTKSQDGTPIYLKQIADIELAHENDSYYGYVEDKPAITLDISAQTGSDVPTVHEKIVSMMEKLEPTLADGYELKLLYAEKNTVDDMFSDLSKELIIAMVAVIIVCMMGLNLITSSIVMLAIPISLAIGLLLLPVFGVTLNQMTIIGVIIVLSLLVDDAIVVNDNIERRRSLGESPMDAAVNGTKEVIISIITATLATIAAFAPMLFLTGDMGKFIRPIPLVITLALLASMLMSLTIVPIFREWYETKRKKDPGAQEKPAGFLGKQIRDLNHFYANKLMKRVVKHPFIVATLGLVIGTFAFGLAAFVPVELFPKSEDPDLSINIEMPTGTSLAETNRFVKEVAKWVEQQEGIEEVTYAAGGSAPQLFLAVSAGSGSEVAQISAVGVEGIDIDGTIEKWNDYFKEKYPGIKMITSGLSTGVSTGDPISFRLTGSDMDELRNIAEQFKNIIAESPATFDIKDSLGNERYSLEFVINKDAMDEYMVSYSDLTTTLRLMTDGIDIGKFDTGNDLLDMTLYLDEKKNEDPMALYQRLSIMNARGEQIPLAQLAELKPAFSVQQIEHYNLERTITVSADVRDGYTATEAMTEILPKIQQLSLPSGYNWSIGGEIEQQTETFTNLGLLFIACIVIIIILITLQFNSISIPAIILTTVYLAAAGGFLGMFITRTPIGFMSVIGITSLAGIVVRNGIVLIEFMEEARREGASLTEAVLKGTQARFRPILLTASAAILGLLPVALLSDILFRPMAITIISGVIFSTCLTLFVVPSLYMVVIRWKAKLFKKDLHDDHRLDGEDSEHEPEFEPTVKS